MVTEPGDDKNKNYLALGFVPDTTTVDPKDRHVLDLFSSPNFIKKSTKLEFKTMIIWSNTDTRHCFSVHTFPPLALEKVVFL